LCPSGKSALLFAFSAPVPFATAATSQTNDAADTREPNAALSGNSWASRTLLMSFQRQRPALPPDTDAGIMQNLQWVRMV
jgi:hypothetical protein